MFFAGERPQCHGVRHLSPVMLGPAWLQIAIEKPIPSNHRGGQRRAGFLFSRTEMCFHDIWQIRNSFEFVILAPLLQSKNQMVKQWALPRLAVEQVFDHKNCGTMPPR